jgi:hypothetical protein
MRATMDEDDTPIAPYQEPPQTFFAPPPTVVTGPRDEEWYSQLEYVVELDRERSRLLKECLKYSEEDEPKELRELQEFVFDQWHGLKWGLRTAEECE